MARRLIEIVVDSRDPEGLAAFWAAALEYRVLDRRDGVVEIGPASGSADRRPRWCSSR